MTTKTMPPPAGTTGVFHDIDIEDYHASKDAISKSGLDDFRHAPLVYWAKRFDPDRPAEEVKKGHLEGNLLHCAFLEPAAFPDRYVTVPETAPKRPSITQRNAKKPAPDTVTAIDWWDNFEMDHRGKTVIDAEQYTTAWKQADSLRKIKELRDAVSQGAPEVSAYAVDPGTGLYVRARPDWVRPYEDSGVVLIDAKTTRDARPSEFSRTAAQKRYHVQDAFYTDVYAAASGTPVLGFVFAAVESEWPYYAAAIELGTASKAQGRKEYQADLRDLAACKRDAAWRDEDAGIQTTELPAWALTEKP